jgi:hypothetical protein
MDQTAYTAWCCRAGTVPALKKKPIKMIGLQYQEKEGLRKIKNQGTTIFLRRPVAAFTTTI